ncbi:beta-lactamase family protein [Teratosphaeria destructans]|uniref:Beta-lactamase family protein n=1 Tax=Teratosphaeria destructans TaxID=418781 RepID=A0A9W7SRC8_9PEZI|nr:beta-lactamase family protein [Teratosphaeria destructans]
MSLSTAAVNDIKAKFDAACVDKQKGLPGVVGVAVGRDGKQLFSHAAGTRGFGSLDPMAVDSVLWIASCTKMITGVACMQLVEIGTLHLDDAEETERLCPEIKDLKVLQKDGSLVAKKRGITLRMLLSHTAGFGYTFFHEGLRDLSKPIGYDEFSGHINDLIQPLVHQPGEGWQYGVGIDWAGFCVERATGMSLNDYFQRYIFHPLGIKNISMFPDKTMKDKLAFMNARLPDGTLAPRDHLLHRPLVLDRKDDIAACANSGGAGAFAQLPEYCKILAMLLNDGKSPTTGARLLQKTTVDQMFENQIPQYPKFGSQGIPASKADLTNTIPDLYPGKSQGWGLTFMLSDGPTGRSDGTAHWAGLPNLFWWCDREKGVAGIVGTQVLPFADAQLLNLWVAFESAVYQAL